MEVGLWRAFVQEQRWSHVGTTVPQPTAPAAPAGPPVSGGRSPKPMASSAAKAARRTVGSSVRRPMIWKPTGRPSEGTHGTLTPGPPARTAGTVDPTDKNIPDRAPTRSPSLNATGSEDRHT